MLEEAEGAINIKTVTLLQPEVKRVVPFSAERDIPPAIWEQVINDVQGELDSCTEVDMFDQGDEAASDEITRFSTNAALLKMISPDRFKQLEFLGWYRVNLRLALEYFQHKPARGNEEIVKLFGNSVTMFPGQILIDDPEVVVKVCDSQIRLLRTNDNPQFPEGAESFITLMQLYPDSVKEFALQKANLIRNMEELAERYKTSGTMRDLAWVLAKMKILAPEKVEKYMVPALWADGKAYVQRPGGPTFRRLDYAADLSILAADRVEVTGEGIKFYTDTKDDQSQTTPIPVLKAH